MDYIVLWAAGGRVERFYPHKTADWAKETFDPYFAVSIEACAVDGIPGVAVQFIR